ncbi:hypothetical protein [Nocardioides sp. R-C-SC26]|uniref:hypothetical protein n=1 Tax=Nocardioides sp. R-C-SC26 TaxID=2870414 RepID=UPI001E37223F|nr:hypothetical protein [Nocardioides sp. R-C-SC26]
MAEPSRGVGDDPLTAVLRTDPPPGIQTLPDDVRARLADQIRVGKARQAELVAEAERQAISGVPLPLRGIVKKALGA